MYPQHAKLIPLVDADPYLNAVLVKYCDEALAYRRARPDTWELRVENAIAPLLPHGQAEMSVIAEKLGTSQRMLSRRLASEGLTFLQVLTRLRFDLAKLYPRAKFADFRSRLASWLSRSERLYACI
jgi:hypothetical protein